MFRRVEPGYVRMKDYNTGNTPVMRIVEAAAMIAAAHGTDKKSQVRFELIDAPEAVRVAVTDLVEANLRIRELQREIDEGPGYESDEPDLGTKFYFNRETEQSYGVVLSPDDPFEAALIPIVEMNRRKRADYAHDGDVFSNFRFTANVMNLPSAESAAVFNVAQKLARLSSLQANNREPQNEAVEDTYLDMAVYAVIAYAIYRERMANRVGVLAEDYSAGSDDSAGKGQVQGCCVQGD